MPIVRFFAEKQRGITLPDISIATHLGALLGLMIDNNISPEACLPGTTTNITPSYAKYNAYDYWLETESADPPERATLHLMPTAADSAASIVTSDGNLEDFALRSIRIPEDTDAFPLLAPYQNGKILKIHQLIVPLPQSVLNEIRALHGTKP